MMTMRFVALAVAALAASVWIGSSLAYSYQQYGDGTLGPGGYFQTAGWNNRSWNIACRKDNSGKMSVSYYDTNMVRIHYSGVIWTSCGAGGGGPKAALENNGYYRCRCTHEGTVSFPVFCQTCNGSDCPPHA